MKSLVARLLVATTCFSFATLSRAESASDSWIRMFNGEDLTGWKANEGAPGSFVVEDGAIKTANGTAHLFYLGSDGHASFTNFEFKARVKQMPGANSGIYIHTEYQATGWPAKGYECQINSDTQSDPRKTGGLYAVKDVMNKSPVPDGQWYDYSIKVEGRHITIRINGETTTDWTEPADWDPTKSLHNMDGRRLSEGTFALQAHDPKSTVFFKDLFVRPLP